MRTELEERIRREAARRLKAQREGRNPLWVGLGSFGIVSWSIAIPALLGVVIGGWLDRSTDSVVSWTLVLLLAGIVLGSMNAWFWMTRIIDSGSRHDLDRELDPNRPQPPDLQERRHE